MIITDTNQLILMFKLTDLHQLNHIITKIKINKLGLVEKIEGLFIRNFEKKY